MRYLKIISLCALIGSSAACIREEAPNAEADIETCMVPGDVLKADPRIENNKITLLVKQSADVTNLALEFTLTAGATIEPESGIARDFTNPQQYVVTSEDGKWTKTYSVEVNRSQITTNYNFEFAELSDTGRYYEFYEIAEDGEKQKFWASGNGGFSIVAGTKPPEEFPTVPGSNGYKGQCLKLETKSTGILGALAKKPLAAGNLFIGKFAAANAMTAPLEATEFGVPFDRVPVRLTGYYKYKRGDVFTDGNGNTVADKKDLFDIYGLFYETDNQVKMLNGTNAKTSPNLIALALFPDEDKLATDEWTYFDIPFVVQSGKTIELAKLKDDRYNVSIVMTASTGGAMFDGAVGSTLMVDEVTLVVAED